MKFLSRLFISTLLLSTCFPLWAREDIRPSVERNAAPTVPLQHFARFELKPVLLPPPYAGQRGNEKARVAVQNNLEKELAPWLAQRNAEPATSEPVTTLVIEPVIEKIRFIGGGKRFFAGALAGGSRMVLRLRLRDSASGEIIAQPEFYQHARALAGAWSLGGADKAMLVRVARLASGYVMTNHNGTQVGSPTGWEE